MNDESRVSNDELPDGWAPSNLGKIVTLNYGKALPDRLRSGSGFPVYGSNGIVGMHNETQTNGETIIVGRKGSVGAVHYSENSCSPIDTTYFIDDFHGLPAKYWFYFLKSLNLVELNKSTAIPGLNREDAYRLDIQLPPLAEQKRIADKLEAVLGRVDACRARLDRVPALLKRFRQSVLSAATSGKLTEEWREENPTLCDASDLANTIRKSHEAAGGHKTGNAASPSEDVHDLVPEMFPEGWHVMTLREVVSPDRPITYGILMPGPELKKGIPYVRVADFPNNRLNLATIRNTSVEMDEKFKRSRLREGDLLLSIRGTVGRMVVIPRELEAANITQDTARLTIQPVMSSTYVLWYLKSMMAQTRMQAATKGVAVRGINIGDVRALQIPLPTLPEQQQIVRRVEALFAMADRIEARLATAQKTVERLTPATLAKAFRGELVPQDPNDEPASKLLERLRSIGPTAPAGRGRRKAAK